MNLIIRFLCAKDCYLQTAPKGLPFNCILSFCPFSIVTRYHQLPLCDIMVNSCHRFRRSSGEVALKVPYVGAIHKSCSFYSTFQKNLSLVWQTTFYISLNFLPIKILRAYQMDVYWNLLTINYIIKMCIEMKFSTCCI